MGGDAWVGWGAGLGGWFFVILFWGLAIMGVVFLVLLVLGWGRGEGEGGRAEPPLEILKRRYARGEITKDEYDRIRQDLE